MRVREMEPADAEAVAAIYNEGIRGRGATFQTEERAASDLEPWVAEAETWPVLVAENGGRIVGWTRASRYSDFARYGGVGELAIYVAATARGGGVGRALVEALADAARERGFSKIVAKVFPENEASIALLRGCGFRVVGTHLRHGQLDGRWRDVLVLERSLD
jgi:L-amino acid N-acyltransferase YncA